MDIETLQPHPSLKKYIDFYYFIRNDSPTFKSIHYSFPHTINAVSIYKQANYKSALGQVEIYSDQQNDFLTLIQAKCQVPLKVELTGRINRISIWFKPFGLNQFLKTPLTAVMKNSTTNRVTEWDEDPQYKKCLAQCFATENQQQQIDLLEEFLFNKFQPIHNSYLEQAIELLSDVHNHYSITAILSQIHVPLRTFNRSFKEMMGVSPIEYKRIVRFRHSLNHKLFNEQFKRLTDIGYNSNFYDQSYFIKMYRKLTGSNPKAFFKAIEKLEDDKLIFQFVKK